MCYNDGAGNFTCTDVSPDVYSGSGVALGDMDGDNDLDAVFANEGAAGEVNRVCYNDGAGNFTCTAVSPFERRSRDVVLGDVDGDNDLDAVFADDGVTHVCYNGAGNFYCADY